MKFDISVLFEIIWTEFKFHKHLTRITFTLHEDLHMYDNVSLNSSQNEKCFRQKMYRKSKHPFYVQLLFFPEIMWIMWKYIVKPDSLPMTLSRGACVLHAGYRYTLGICNTYCFSTATVVTRTRLNVTLHYIACLFQFFINCSNKEA